MNDYLSSIIDAALSYATPLPLPTEVAFDNNSTECREYRDHENQDSLADGYVTQDVEATFPSSIVYNGLNNLDGCIVTEQGASQNITIETGDSSVIHCDINSNVGSETTNQYEEISNHSDKIAGLETEILQNEAGIELNSPLKNLLRAPCNEKDTKRKRKRNAKRNQNESESSNNQSTESTQNGGYGLDTPMGVNEGSVVQEKITDFEGLLNSSPSVSPVPLHNVDISVSSPTISETVPVPEVKKKRTRRREVNPDKTPPPQILPPCKVCDDKSSGFHYGANTCEACKGFFRRTLKKKEVTFQCKCTEQEREAWKRGPFKNSCPACRYERCLEIGMSKNAIKIGRYTLDRKTENIKEVKSLEAMDVVIQNAITEATNADSPDCREASQFLEGLQINSPGDMSTINMAASTPLSEENSAAEPRAKKPRGDVISDEDTRSSTDISRTGGMTLKEIDTIVKTLSDAFNTYRICETKNINVDLIRQRQNKCLERYALKTALFGKMTCPSNDEFKEFYQATGIELDDRFKDMQKAMDFFESRISGIVAYAKCIPGFRELHLDDQASLIKASRVESMLIRGYRVLMTGINIDQQVIATPWGSEYHMDEIEKILPKDFVNRRYKMALAMKKLDLTMQEEAIMRAIAITFPDRCELHAPEMVEQIQFKLLTCLEHLLSVRPGGPGNKMYKIFDVLTQLRDLTEHESVLAKKMFLDWPDLYSNYYLLSEFLR